MKNYIEVKEIILKIDTPFTLVDDLHPNKMIGKLIAPGTS
ncbi:hypothetical protein CHRYSEOSP005_14840 [Chryseobacterium sp. Alg-005]